MSPPRVAGIRSFRAVTRPNALLIGMLAGVLILNSLVPAGFAVFIQQLISRVDRVHLRSGFAEVVVPLIVIGSVLVFGHIAEGFHRALEFLVQTRIDGHHRASIARAVVAAPLALVEGERVQQLLREACADPEIGLDVTPGEGIVAALRWIAGLAGGVASCAVVGWYVPAVAPLLFLCAVLGVYLRRREYGKLVEALRFAVDEEMHANVWRSATVAVAEGKDLRTFGFAHWMTDRMQRHIEVGNRPYWDYFEGLVRRSWTRPALVSTGLVPSYVAASLAAEHGAISVAALTAVLLSAWSIFQAIGSGEDLYSIALARKVLASTDALYQELDHTSGAVGPVLDRWLQAPSVEFKDVAFRYAPGGPLILDGMNLSIRSGEMLAIVGINGAGKSTAIKLLAGLYQPTSGRITVDGRDISAIGAEAWSSALSVVFQDFNRYHLSLADNILLGYDTTEVDRANLESAAREAGLDRIIDKLPLGWDTPLSRQRPNGVELSGGEWQQVVLARALYAVMCGAQILVLDEPTAHLDVRTELQLFERLIGRRTGTSLVLISHRLATVRKADRIVLLERGRVSESGSHDDLMALDGRYAEMFSAQAERFQQVSDVESDAGV
ncbi:ABC transporter ATP-binding protein [Streptomyces canus]|uniref:ABC transporter ATP-binding protein n=1 Tax=Streptomyces canus TaxID=58343 RepID=UPI0033B61545